MATTVSYKGSTIATVSNNTKTLETEGKYLEADIILTDNTHITTLQSKSATPTESAQAIIPDSGYDGLSQVDVGAISSTYVGTGVSRQAAQTIYPSSSDQTIAADKYLTGAQTIKGVITSNITAANIKKDVVVEVGDSDDSDRVLSVTGTYEGDPALYTKIAYGVATAYYNENNNSICYLDLPFPAGASTRIISAVAICNADYIHPTSAGAVAFVYNILGGPYVEMLQYSYQSGQGKPTVTRMDNGLDFNNETGQFSFGRPFFLSTNPVFECICSYIESPIEPTVHVAVVYPESGMSSVTFDNLEDDGDIVYFSCMLGDSLEIPDAQYYRTIGVTGINCDGNWRTFGLYFGQDAIHTSDNQYFTVNYSNHSLTINALPLAGTGYFHSGVYELLYVTSSNPYQAKKITPSSNMQIVYADADEEAIGFVEVDAIPSGFVYSPTVTKGTVSNGSINVTPTVNYEEGYIGTGTRNGSAVTVYASELVSGTETKTANGTYDVTNLSKLVVNVSNGGSPYGGLDLLATLSLGTISTSSTTATNTKKSVSVPNVNNYDLLIVETTVATRVNGQHLGTTNLIWLTASSNVSTKNGSAISTATWNAKIDSSGIATTRSSTTKYGIYANSCTVSNGTATIPMYQRYNSTQTGTINGNYTTRVYGVRIYTLAP